MTPALWLIFAVVCVFCAGTVAYCIATAPRDKDRP